MNSIKLELNNFSNVFNKHEVTGYVCSTQQKFGLFDCYLAAKVNKSEQQNDFFLGVYFFCKSGNGNFPVYTHAKFFILNKDSRKSFSIGKYTFM